MCVVIGVYSLLIEVLADGGDPPLSYSCRYTPVSILYPLYWYNATSMHTMPFLAMWDLALRLKG